MFKYRFELKYYISFANYFILKKRLSILLPYDSNADGEGNYHIRSLYFDDYKNTALFSKLDGVNNREKYRIRIYNYSDKNIKLEKKIKKGKFILKKSSNLTREDFNSLILGSYDSLIKSEDPLKQELYYLIKSHTLKPRVIVDYTREAYIGKINNIRITFDKNLKTALSSTDIFNKNLPTIDVDTDNKDYILEVKFNHFLPDYLKDILTLESAKHCAISKYVLARTYINYNNWENN